MSPRTPVSLDALKRELDDRLLQRAEELRSLGDEIHRDPELGCREFHAVTRLTGELEEEGFQVRTGIAGLPTAFRAEKGEGGPAIALLAEYDALPGLGHGCGHHLIVETAFGAAVALSRVLDRTGGRVVVIGAPAEETIGGKVVLAVRGAFDDIDAALLAHPGGEDCAVVTSLASWSVEVLFQGLSAHAVAAPERGVNALDAMIRLFVARDSLVESLGPGVRMPGVILEGGVRPNVVPARARARFSLRAEQGAHLVQRVLPRFEEAVASIASATGSRALVTPIDNLYDEMISNPTLAEIYRRNALSAGLSPTERPERIVGSLDMGTLSQMLPALHPVFPVADEYVATHTERFTRLSNDPRAHRSALSAARALAATAFDLLTQPALLERARQTHAEQMAGRPPRIDAPLVVDPVDP